MARGRRRQTKPEPIALSNVSDATIQEFYDKALNAKVEHEEALKEAKSKNGMFRAVLKDAKRVGVPTSMLLWRLAQRHRTPDEIDRETKERNRIARLTNLPVGTQLGLLDDGTTVATAIDNDHQADQQGDADIDARQAGYNAGRAGKTLSSNPHMEGSDEFDEFEAGWGAAMGDNLLGKNKSGKATRNGAAAH